MVTFKPEKYTNKRLNKKMTSVIPDDSKSNPPKYMCNNCNVRLGILPDDTWLCPLCRKVYIPQIQQVRKEIDFTVPTDTEHYIEPAIISLDHNEDVRIKKEPNYQGGIKALREKGLNITSYSETDGAGRPIRVRDEDEEEW